MEKEIISSMVATLPEGNISEIQHNNENWEETDGGAHFIVTRQMLSTTTGEGLEALTMSVSGQPSERIRVICEFSQVFGNPEAHSIDSESTSSVDVAIWLFPDRI